MEDAGQKLKRVRERLGLRYRDVEQASLSIAQRHGNDEFFLALSRLSDIENKGSVPSVFRLYSLCVIYRLDFVETLSWFGVSLSQLPADAASLPIDNTHAIGFSSNDYSQTHIPIALDPGIDLRKTTFLSRMIQRWGTLPLILLNRLDLKNHVYGFIGNEDWSMHPILAPGSLILIDTTRRDLSPGVWANEYERPIHFLEHRDGFRCGWCSLDEQRANLIVQPHPASGKNPTVFRYPNEVEVIGQVTGVAMRLVQGPRRRTRS
ncbi:MAG: helix-turn-helix transcriptional regulator [Bryobacteraceae bacterium]